MLTIKNKCSSYNVKKRERKKCILKQIKNCLFSIFIENTERKYTKIGYLVKKKKTKKKNKQLMD